MVIHLDIPDELEHELNTEARRLGLALEQYAIQLLSGRATAGSERPRTGSELVDYWRREGVIGYRTDIADSAAHARRLRHQAEQRSRG